MEADGQPAVHPLPPANGQPILLIFHEVAEIATVWAAVTCTAVLQDP
jgi:hypothetical protein